MTYRPFRFFAIPGLLIIIIGLVPTGRFLYFYSIGIGGGNIQSLLYSVLFLGSGAALIVAGFLADLIGVNRQLLEDIRTRIREIELRQTLENKEQK